MLGMRLCRHDGRGAEKGSRLFKEISDLLDYCSRHLGIYRYRPVDEGCIDSAVMAARNRRPRRRYLHDGFSKNLRVPELQCSISTKVILTITGPRSKARDDEHCVSAPDSLQYRIFAPCVRIQSRKIYPSTNVVILRRLATANFAKIPPEDAI